MTGPAALLPQYTFGFWQSKMRCTTQQELMDVARKYREKGYPLDIIVVDFYHWTKMGDFQFDPACWPAPEEMFAQLKEMDVQCMASMWLCPRMDIFVCVRSRKTAHSIWPRSVATVNARHLGNHK